MAFNFGSFLDAATQAASHVVALAAGAQSTVHSLSSSDPLIATAVNLVEKEVPGFSQIEGIFDTVLTLAQSAVSALQQTAAAAGTPPAKPAT